MQMRNRGFSLIEIVIAMGIIAFALVAIVGMFPVAMKASRDSRDETHAAMISQLILGQLRSQVSTNPTFATGSDPTVASNNLVVNLKPPSVIRYWALYDDTGQPIRQATTAQFDGSSAVPAPFNQRCAYQARLTVESEKPIPGISQIKVDVVYPGTAPAAARKTNSFVTFMRNSGS